MLINTNYIRYPIYFILYFTLFLYILRIFTLTISDSEISVDTYIIYLFNIRGIPIILIFAILYFQRKFGTKPSDIIDFLNYKNSNKDLSNFIKYHGQAIQGTTGLIWERFAIGQKWDDFLDINYDSPKLMNFKEALTVKSDYRGDNEWRLPNIDELNTIVKKNTSFYHNIFSQIDLSIFFNTPADFFWSSSLSDDGKKVKGICFKNGIIVERHKDEKGYVRLVRDRSFEIQKIQLMKENENEKFETFDDQVIQKNKNLVWQRYVFGQKWRFFGSNTKTEKLMTFEEAILLKREFTNIDWRLPSIDELKGLLKYSFNIEKKIDSSIFPNTPADFFWSYNTSDDGSKVKCVCFKRGVVVEKSRNDKGYVRLVRNNTTEIKKNTSFYKSYVYLLMCFLIFIIIFSVPNYLQNYHSDNLSLFFSEFIKTLDKKTQNVKNTFIISLVKNHQPTGSILINGKLKVDYTLSITNTLADVDKLGDFSYQWLRNNKEIPNATNQTYTLIESDIGKKITVNVSYLDGEGNNESITSSPTPIISSAISTEPTSWNDVLTGTDKKDSLNGLDGDDILIGGLDSDTLTGGSGADTFKFNSVQDSGINSDSRDVITDFNHTEKDKLDFTAITKKISLHFIGNQPFNKTDAAGEIRFDTTNHILYVSTNMDNKPEFSIEFKGTKNLSNDDFVFQNSNSK